VRPATSHTPPPPPTSFLAPRACFSFRALNWKLEIGDYRSKNPEMPGPPACCLLAGPVCVSSTPNRPIATPNRIQSTPQSTTTTVGSVGSTESKSKAMRPRGYNRPYHAPPPFVSPPPCSSAPAPREAIGLRHTQHHIKHHIQRHPWAVDDEHMVAHRGARGSPNPCLSARVRLGLAWRLACACVCASTAHPGYQRDYLQRTRSRYNR
jgi:hypothetical protein